MNMVAVYVYTHVASEKVKIGEFNPLTTTVGKLKDTIAKNMVWRREWFRLSYFDDDKMYYYPAEAFLSHIKVSPSTSLLGKNTAPSEMEFAVTLESLSLLAGWKNAMLRPMQRHL
ncbi:hypothetical protein H4S04_002791 [Coemansia sp. S16]|nr:hypothetical protein H4S04_002791 [Coemansia sp. S16]KAJ2068099.1 hypothetical protein GGI08_001051 [Coemansia sp. S2]